MLKLSIVILNISILNIVTSNIVKSAILGHLCTLLKKVVDILWEGEMFLSTEIGLSRSFGEKWLA